MLAKLCYWISSSTAMRFATTLHFPWQYFNTKAKSCVLYFLQLFSIDARFVNKFPESHEAGSFSWTDHKIVGLFTQAWNRLEHFHDSFGTVSMIRLNHSDRSSWKFNTNFKVHCIHEGPIFFSLAYLLVEQLFIFCGTLLKVP